MRHAAAIELKIQKLAKHSPVLHDDQSRITKRLAPPPSPEKTAVAIATDVLSKLALKKTGKLKPIYDNSGDDTGEVVVCGIDH